jgi:nitrate/nitrite transporter NarK
LLALSAGVATCVACAAVAERLVEHNLVEEQQIYLWPEALLDRDELEALGLGNGAVFKLVPQFFPKETGTVTGLVGAFGGLGGFFPPLALGLIRDATGGYAWGFVFLACFALACLAVHYFTLVRPGGEARPTRATVGGPQAALR